MPQNYITKSASDIACWFIENNPFLKYDKFGNKENHLKIEKLLHYSNVIMNLLKNRDIFSEEVVAYREGFVIEDFYKEYRENASDIYSKKLRNDFDDDEKMALCLTNILFGRLTGFELSRCVHMDDIWEKYDTAACDVGSHKVLEKSDIFSYYGKQKGFRQNIEYCLQNLDEEKRFIENIKVYKLCKPDDVFFYYNKDMTLTEEDMKVLRCISEENGADSETKYYYLFKDESGVLCIEE